MPALYSVCGLCLAIITITLDMFYNHHYINYVPKLFLTRVDLATTILATLSSALITMTTFTFSMTMVVLTTYSSQFSPRALPNFMTQKTTMRVLGIFLGGFIYAVCSLLFMRKSMESEYVISAVIAVFLTIICLLFFIYFIHFISKSIQVDHLIEKLSQEMLSSSNKLTNKMKENKVSTVIEIPISAQIEHLYECKSSSYVQSINLEELVSLSASHNAFIKVHYKIGEYISENTILFSIHSDQKELEAGLMEKCAEHITLGDERSSSQSQDLSFSIQQLVEIAIRATSPAINDPYTAKHCIRNIGKVLANSTTFLHGDHLLYKDHENNPRLMLPMENFKNLLYSTFFQFEINSSKDIAILGTIMDALMMVAQKSTVEMKRIIWNFLEYKMHPLANIGDLHLLDREYIERKKNELFEATH